MNGYLKKGFISIFLLAILCATVFCGLNIENNKAYGATEYVYAGTSVFNINSQEDFESFYNTFHNENHTFSGKIVNLNCDADMYGNPYLINNFSGTFYGNNYTLRNIGGTLFGNSNDIKTKIYDLNVINYNSTNSAAALYYRNYGLLQNVKVSGIISYTSMGGLVYYNHGTVKNCYSNLKLAAIKNPLNEGIGGIVFTNYGNIYDSHFTGDIIAVNTVKSLGGIAAKNLSYTQNENTVYPAIERCGAVSEIIFETSGIPEHDSSLPEKSGAVIGQNTSKIANCYFIGYYPSYLSAPVLVVGDDTGNTHLSPYANIYMMTDTHKIVYDNQTSAFIACVGAISDYIDFASPHNNVYVSENCDYPLLKILDGSGKAENPFIIKSAFDFYKIRELFNPDNIGYNVILAGDIDCRYYNISVGLKNNSTSTVINGRGYALLNYGGERLFKSEHLENIRALGFYNSPNYLHSGNSFNETSNYNFGYSELKDTNSVLAVQPQEGSGTEQNPYRIKTVAELAYLKGSEGVFELACCINVNSEDSLTLNYLNITSFSGTLDGKGYSITGLYESLTGTNNGTIKNLVLKGYCPISSGALAASTNNGSIINVKIYSSVSEETVSYASVAVTNKGLISKVVADGFDSVYQTAVSGIAVINEKDIINCMVKMPSTYTFAENFMENGIVKTSIGIESGVFSAYNNNQKLVMNYFSLIEAGFDMLNVYGYEINTSLNYPALREKGLIYKKEKDLYDKTNIFIYTYSETQNISKTNIVNSIIDSIDNISILWTYNQSDYSEPATLHNAGTYNVSFIYSGDNLYLPSKYSQDITINKKKIEEAPQFENGAFSDITKIYDGLNAEISEPVPLNYENFTFTYEIKKNDIQFHTVLDAGIYIQTMSGNSVNYQDVIWSRVITVNKAPIAIKVGGLEIDYLADADLNSCSVTITSGLVPSDIALPLSQLIIEETFSANYAKGDDAGNYYIDYTAVFKNYSISSVEKGILTVNKIDLPQDGIVFGNKAVSYTGEAFTITASGIPEGISVAYSQNSYSNAGNYNVTASFSNKNYNGFTLEAVLTINKADLLFNAKNILLDYDKDRTALNQELFSYTLSGLAESDLGNKEILINGLSFIYYVKKNNEIITVFDAESYDIILEIDGILDNYNINSAQGILTINPVPMTSLYTHSDCVFVYNGEELSHPITFFQSYGVTVEYVYNKNSQPVESIINAGIYNITATVPKINTNYTDTVYTYKITVNKADINISFENPSYSGIYSAENLADSVRYPYTGDLPDNLTAMFSIEKDGITVSEAKNAGVYTLIYFISESENYKSCRIEAVFTVNPKDITLEVENSYTYTGNNIIPIVKNINGDYGELVPSTFIYTYYNDKGEQQARVTRAGNYSISINLSNNNFILLNNSFNFTVKKLYADIDLKYLEYDYGFVGDINYGGIDYKIYSGGIVVRRNYYLPATGATIDISYGIGNDYAGTYTVHSINGGENYVFTISSISQYDNNNKIKIRPVILSQIWRLGNTDLKDINCLIEYSGIDQMQFFGFIITGFVNNHKQENFEFVMKERNSKTIKDAGSYELFIILNNENNYVMDGSSLYITIYKATLNVVMLDLNIMQGEPFIRRSYRLEKLVGDDYGTTDIYSLKNANLTVVCDYTQNSKEGDKFEYYFEGTFANYEMVTVRKGTLTVIKNSKIEFTLLPAAYYYDGTYKSLKVLQSQEIIDRANVDLIYSENNYQKNVGTYDITLTVIYHVDSSQKTYTNTLTILAAYPKLAMEEISVVFKDNLTLSHDIIKGKAYLGDNEVPGTFRFAESYKLEQGRKESGYDIAFFPADTANLLPVAQTYYINAVVIDASIFQYSDLTKITYTQKGIEITGPIVVTLKSILPGLSLYKNQNLMDKVELNKTEQFTLSIKFHGEEIYTQSMEVKYIDTSIPVEIIVDESYLHMDIGLSLNKKELTVDSSGGRIAISDEHKNDYVLYINGNKIIEDYPINGNEKTIVVVIKDARTSAVVFAEEYKVLQKLPDNGRKNDNATLWIILSSAVGGSLLLILLFFVLKKFISDKKLGFNPYNRK